MRRKTLLAATAVALTALLITTAFAGAQVAIIIRQAVQTFAVQYAPCQIQCTAFSLDFNTESMKYDSVTLDLVNTDTTDSHTAAVGITIEKQVDGTTGYHRARWTGELLAGEAKTLTLLLDYPIDPIANITSIRMIITQVE